MMEMDLKLTAVEYVVFDEADRYNVRKNKYGLLTKLVQLRWLDIGQVLFFACLWTSTPSRSINSQKKNEANIQPS